MGENTESQAQVQHLIGQMTIAREMKDNNTLTRALRSCCFIPQRYVLSLLGLLGVCNALVTRVCLNLAITQMVNRTHIEGSHVNLDACPTDVVQAIDASSSLIKHDRPVSQCIGAPNYTGTLSSLVNTSSTLTGIITPYLIGLLTPDSTLAQWRIAFWVCFVVLVGTNVVYCIWADGKQQWWDDVRQYGYPADWKLGQLVPNENPKAEEALHSTKSHNVVVNEKF